jgi:hypothetical protein
MDNFFKLFLAGMILLATPYIPVPLWPYLANPLH